MPWRPVHPDRPQYIFQLDVALQLFRGLVWMAKASLEPICGGNIRVTHLGERMDLTGHRQSIAVGTFEMEG